MAIVGVVGHTNVPSQASQELTRIYNMQDKIMYRTDECTPGLRGYARYNRGGTLEVYFMVSDPNNTCRHTFSIIKYGFGHAYLLATETYSYLHNLSLIEEMDVLGKMPTKELLTDQLMLSLHRRDSAVTSDELLEMMG